MRLKTRRTLGTVGTVAMLVAAGLMLSQTTHGQSQGRRVDDAMLRNAGAGGPGNDDWLTYGLDQGEKRYSPAVCTGAEKVIRLGDPDPKHISTSYVERHNLSVRMTVRRFTRLTNAFSKKWEKLYAMLALYFGWYNFCRVHSTIGCTPAVKSGLATETWSVKRLIEEVNKLL